MGRIRIESLVRFLSSLAIATTAFFGTEVSAQLHGVDSPLKRGLDSLVRETGVPEKPYQVSSRFHLMEGTTSGYLVVQVQLTEGAYMYSLNQAGAIKPTKIDVVPSAAFVLDGKFNPDRPAEVIENDPVFNQRVEKHKGKVQFFVPVKFDAEASVGDVQPEIVINGQVCSNDGVCLPIRDQRVTAEFGGFFGRTVEAPQTPEAPTLR